MSKTYSHYWIHLAVNELGGIEVRIRNTSTEKEVFDDSSYSFEHLYEKYLEAKQDLLNIPELKKLVERS